MVFVLDIPYGDPLVAFKPFAEEPFAQLLHSCPGAEGGGRYSYILSHPFKRLVWHQGDGGNPFDMLSSAMGEHHIEKPDRDLPPFWGGAVGFFSYELGRVLENIKPDVADDMGLPHLCFGFYDCIAAFDHKTKRAQIISTGLPETSESLCLARAKERAEALANQLGTGAAKSILPALLQPRANLPKEQYLKKIKRAIDYIYEGDIYQANITQRFETQLPKEVCFFDVFEHLCELSPVSYSAFLNFPDGSIASLSPERFLCLEARGPQRSIETRPIKGTAARGKTHDLDIALKENLQISKKDRAENTMIVDLLRNDLSKVCRDHTVQVDALCAVESYADVHHLVSTVSGVLREDCDAITAIKECFPGGSITGVPKVRAMEIIAELEGMARGPYCGSIGYIGFDGAMDTNIAIRTLVSPRGAEKEKQALFYQVGGGIVADSEPEMEYEECLSKARSFFALGGTES